MIINHVAKLAGERKKSVRQVCEETGLAYNTVLSLFRGNATRVDLFTLDGVCRALGVQPGDLFEWVPELLGHDAAKETNVGE